MCCSCCGEVGGGRAERRRRWCSWDGVMVSVLEDVVEVSMDGRREEIDQVGWERRESTSMGPLAEGCSRRVVVVVK